jgi:predicted RNase H-like HicB family nuclease
LANQNAAEESAARHGRYATVDPPSTADFAFSSEPWYINLQSALCEGLVDVYRLNLESAFMHNEFTAIVERDGEWFIAYCPEVPGANGQGRSRDESLASLRDAIALILEDRREDGLRGVPEDADRTVVTVE